MKQTVIAFTVQGQRNRKVFYFVGTSIEQITKDAQAILFRSCEKIVGNFQAISMDDFMKLPKYEEVAKIIDGLSPECPSCFLFSEECPKQTCFC